MIMYLLLILLGILAGPPLIYELIIIIKKAKKYDRDWLELNNQKKELEIEESQLKGRQANWEVRVQYEKDEWENKVKLEKEEWGKKVKADIDAWAKKFKSDKEAIDILTKEKSQGFPWLAEAYAEYFYLQDLKTAKHLRNKKHPAPKAAENVREIGRERRKAEKLMRIYKSQLKYYEGLFPWLVEFIDEDIDEYIVQLQNNKQNLEDYVNIDPARKWLTAAEYEKLSNTEKFQLALDRYFKKRKSKWEIGRDYERYIGYLYETREYAVYYQGIIEGFNDLGRDLIAQKGIQTEVIQCKYWSKHKQIHEKHIFQLYGTMVAYKIDNPSKDVSGTFTTSTQLTDRAKMFAEHLRIEVLENHPLEEYPCIKCNISRKDKSKIYHLPFDQQYDTTVIEKNRNECYVKTIKEAEDLGFRRAFRWSGNPTP
ncbi:MAG: hypothetical protein E3J72_20895 [Planctomycetota bacterium]|nr:MAG: hypothetical protein E3J72_20895 [Planctomycetota bacterium]